MNIIIKIFKWLALSLGILFLIFMVLMFTYLVKNDFYVFKSHYELMMSHPHINTKVPNYSLHVIEKKSTKRIKLENLRGKNILLFWYSNCPGADYALPHLGKISEIYKNDLQIYIIHQFDEDTVISTKNQYNNLFLCKGRTRNREYFFAHPGASHNVLINKRSKVVAYGNLHWFDLIPILEYIVDDKEFDSYINEIINSKVNEYEMYRATYQNKL